LRSSGVAARVGAESVRDGGLAGAERQKFWKVSALA
jgi:hypothetical protein